MSARPWTQIGKVSHVLEWLEEEVEIPSLKDVFKEASVDGALLCHFQTPKLTKRSCVYNVPHARLHRRKLFMHLDTLKGNLEEENHRLQYLQEEKSSSRNHP